MIGEIIIIASSMNAGGVYMQTSEKSINMITIAPPKMVYRKAEESEVAKIFNELACHWRTDTMYFSDSDAMVKDPSYRAIVSLGERAVPLMLRELVGENPVHWFSALTEITGDNPIAPENDGNIDLMAASWIEWGKQHGYTS